MQPTGACWVRTGIWYVDKDDEAHGRTVLSRLMGKLAAWLQVRSVYLSRGA